MFHIIWKKIRVDKEMLQNRKHYHVSDSLAGTPFISSTVFDVFLAVFVGVLHHPDVLGKSGLLIQTTYPGCSSGHGIEADARSYSPTPLPLQ